MSLASNEGRIRFWRPDTGAVTGMLRVENEARGRTTYAEHFMVVAVYDGAFDGWYRGQVLPHVAGSLKLKEPGEVHRDLRVHAPFTLQGAAFAPAQIDAAASALGLRGGTHFRAPSFAPAARATRIAFAMHAALARDDASELERTTLIAETLGAVLGPDAAADRRHRAPRAVRRARDFLHQAVRRKVTLDDVAADAGLDKFHLVRAFRREVGLPPYEYLTHLRISRARALLQLGWRASAAAHEVGFFDESQLHRHFRRIVGVTPGVYARSVTGREQKRQHRPSLAGDSGAP